MVPEKLMRLLLVVRDLQRVSELRLFLAWRHGHANTPDAAQQQGSR